MQLLPMEHGVSTSDRLLLFLTWSKSSLESTAVLEIQQDASAQALPRTGRKKIDFTDLHGANLFLYPDLLLAFSYFIFSWCSAAPYNIF